MLNHVIKRTPIFIIPAAILVVGWVLIPYIAALTPGKQELVQAAPYLVTALGLFLAVHFHRGRPFLALLVLLLFCWGSRAFLAAHSEELAFNRFYQACVLLIPVNLALFTLLRERGLFSAAGRLRFAFMAAQAVVIFFLLRYHFPDLLPYIARSYTWMPHWERLRVPQPAMLAGGVSFLVIGWLALRRQTPFDSGMLGVLASFFIACNWLHDSSVHAVYCVAGSLIIAQSLVRDSYNMAFRDDLTGIPSRRALNESLHGLGRRYVLAMLDVDHFKQFNDTHGHDVRDQVLKMVGAKMLAVGGGGKAYRYGGEEFTIVFPGQDCQVLPHLEELRKAIADYRLALRSKDRPKVNRQGKVQRGKSAASSVAVTISIGVAEATEELKTAEEVLKAADKALYKAKHRGRNQISR